MNKKFRRTKSMDPSNNISKKNLTDSFCQLSQNKIIPFVNQRYSLIQKQNLIHTSTKNKQIKTDKALYLSCLVLFNRLQKYVKASASTKLFIFFKKKTFRQKLLNYIKIISQKNKTQAFAKIKKNYVVHTMPEKLLLLSFINKKIRHNELSLSFRKIIMFQNQNKSNKMFKTYLKAGKFQQIQQYRKRQNSSRTIKPTYSQLQFPKSTHLSNQRLKNTNSYQLKPDVYKTSRSNLSNIWKIQKQLNNIQNQQIL